VSDPLLSFGAWHGRRRSSGAPSAGIRTAQWAGRCPACGAWGTISAMPAEPFRQAPPGRRRRS
jgi:hypothetical protein